MARPQGELEFGIVSDGGTVQWKDAYSTYGIFFTQNSLSKLMTPAPNKAAIENKSRNKDGKEVIRKPMYAKKDDRDIDIEFHLVAPNETTFWQRYDAFCTQVLDAGFFDIRTSLCPGRVFHMTYLSCSQFSVFCQELAKFTLRLNEPNPSDRT